MPYCTDFTRVFRGQPPVVLFPSSTAQVSQILGYCHQQHLAVVPQGGNTGVVGGGISVFDEIVLSLSRFNQIRTFDPISGALVCDAGCILQSLDTFLAPHQRCMPLDLGAKGTCQIGGNVATHAGGIHFIKFGPLRGSILGLEVVLADGRIVNALSTAQKDNTGYNVSQWFVGSEGTLGVITGVAVQTYPQAQHKSVAMVAINQVDQLRSVLGLTQQQLLTTQSAFPPRTLPFAQPHPYYVLIEAEGADETVAQECDNLWAYRELIPSLLATKMTLAYDLTLPLDQFYSIVEILRQRLQECGLYVGPNDHQSPVELVAGFGHFGDGNVHLLISIRCAEQQVLECIEPFIYDWTKHGIGQAKSQYLTRARSPAVVALMKQMKQMLDPTGIMNPYKLLPACQRRTAGSASEEAFIGGVM
ncbi:D-lactate ferricytochrome c oxidoreductase [Dimargaris verticillata]|uniref:D-lactate ferricytochrome c oxidoreductase n=1 Tax=Dimargaris verticillata TaxID=2761393 RepID=A0A9W8B6W8_9FUNG|nr:D-lactate ferricytochrome c oxidoreductase [Dimargaris verticillata]